MKTFNEIMKIRDEPDNKPEVTKRKFQVKKTNNEKMQAFGWASVAIAENGETLEDWQGDIIEPDELESAAYKFVDLYREGGEMHERGGVAYLIESVYLRKRRWRQWESRKVHSLLAGGLDSSLQMRMFGRQ